jgi:hypothetical protein
MHQPPGNLRLLLDENEWEAQQIIRCYERVPRYARLYSDRAKIHVGFSGILLEQLLSREIVDRYRAFVDIPAVLDAYKNSPNIEILGMGYYHPLFPLIPQEDWKDQLEMGRSILGEVFGREPTGFWPPEMAFDMKMIPALAEAGYEYVVVDNVHVQAPDGCPVDKYRPHLACEGGAEIAVIPRDRDLSNAQESGLDAEWFIDRVTNAVRDDSRGAPALVTTWSDGENGGWFRQMAEEAGFFGHFFAPFMERVASGTSPVAPSLISDFLKVNPPESEVVVRTGAWNVADTSGYDFSHWDGSPAQREAIEKVFEVSRRYWSLRRSGVPDEFLDKLEEARGVILESETSCFLYWGDAWIPMLHERTVRAERILKDIETHAGRNGWMGRQ